jgi:hypothetical protein
VKFTDTFDKEGINRIVDNPTPKPASRRTATIEARPGTMGGAIRKTESDYGYGKSYMTNDDQEQIFHYTGVAGDEEFSRFRDRLRRGKVKMCESCGGVMSKTTRMILSPFCGLLLIALGVGLMVIYGLATNFYQPPWFIKFALPAGYYVGSIFIGVGILFFFIREKVWICDKCKEIRKR